MPKSRRRTRLGDSSGNGYTYATGPNAGQPVTDNPLQVSTDIPPSFVDIFGTAAPTVSFAPAPTPLPLVSPNTLLAAAKLPSAPAVVQQAATQYSAANPISAWIQGSSFAGIPNYLLLAAVGLVVILPAMAKGRRR